MPGKTILEVKVNKSTLEKEVKFYLLNLTGLRDRLLAIGATMVSPRHREINYRFDTPDRTLGNSGRALRLRQADQVTLTFKGPSSQEGGVRVRAEYEVEVDNLLNAQAILEGLGYIQTICYEKYRAVYHYNNLEISLDELPYGQFAEIEGEDPAAIQLAARILALNWENRVQASYLELFEQLKKNENLSATDLTFQEFMSIPVTGQDLGVKPADTPAFL